jgi:hypothetical protein
MEPENAATYRKPIVTVSLQGGLFAEGGLPTWGTEMYDHMLLFSLGESRVAIPILNAVLLPAV